MAKKRVGIRNGALFNQTSTLWNNLVAYWTGDNTPNDALGTYNGTLTNGATYGTGIINQGFSLDGVNDYVNMGNVLDFNGDTPFSFSCWINPLGSTSVNILSKFLNGGSYPGYTLLLTTNLVRFIIQNNNSTDRLIVTTTSTLTSGMRHITLTYDGSTNASGAKIYVDGVNQSLTVKRDTFTGGLTTGSDFELGGYVIGLGHFNGIVDEVGVWEKELSASEVTELYNSGNGKQYTPPVVSTPSIITDGLVLNLDAGNTSSYPGTGTDWFDLTSNNNDGVLTNGVSYLTDNGGVMSFDGVNDFIQVGQISNVTTTTYISAWIKLGSLTDDYRIFGFGNGSSNTFQLVFEGDTTNKPLGLNTYNNDLYGIDTTQVDYTNGWFNVTIGLHSNDFSSTKIYINGNNIQTSQKLGTSINRVFNNTFTIGTLQWNFASSWYFNGEISDVKIYNKALTDSEVLQNYNATKGRFSL